VESAKSACHFNLDVDWDRTNEEKSHFLRDFLLNFWLLPSRNPDIRQGSILRSRNKGGEVFHPDESRGAVSKPLQ